MRNERSFNYKTLDKYYRDYKYNHIININTEGNFTETCMESKNVQKVEIYSDMFNAKEDMERHIENGWRVHTCTMNSGLYHEQLLVVYEKTNT